MVLPGAGGAWGGGSGGCGWVGWCACVGGRMGGWVDGWADGRVGGWEWMGEQSGLWVGGGGRSSGRPRVLPLAFPRHAAPSPDLPLPRPAHCTTHPPSCRSSSPPSPPSPPPSPSAPTCCASATEPPPLASSWQRSGGAGHAAQQAGDLLCRLPCASAAQPSVAATCEFAARRCRHVPPPCWAAVCHA